MTLTWQTVWDELNNMSQKLTDISDCIRIIKLFLNGLTLFYYRFSKYVSLLQIWKNWVQRCLMANFLYVTINVFMVFACC